MVPAAVELQSKSAVVGAERAPALIAYLERERVRIEPPPAEFQAKIRAGEIEVVLEIDAAFESDVAAGRAARVRLYYDESRQRTGTTTRAVRGLLRGFAALWGDQRLALRGIAADAGPTAAPPADGKLPPFTPSAALGANCQYPGDGAPAKPVNAPRTGKVPTDPAQVSASMSTSQGNIGLQLDNAKAPCTVNSFASLATQGYFNDTPCHRLTTAPDLSVLQCGDPTGMGTGGPGYGFGNEYPTDQYPDDDPGLSMPVTYPRGTLAMANTGQPNSNGSQFFLVYQDSRLPPNYTVFGTIDETGLATLDKIAEAGVKGGGGDGAPSVDVHVKTVALD